jgi:hypothetical protein
MLCEIEVGRSSVGEWITTTVLVHNRRRVPLPTSRRISNRRTGLHVCEILRNQCSTTKVTKCRPNGAMDILVAVRISKV